ncbi:transposase (fragment) [Vibrio coralliirubri]
MSQGALQGFIDSIFRLIHVPLSCPHYTCISHRTRQVEASFNTKTRGAIQHLAIDVTGVKIYGEGEWKLKNKGRMVSVEFGESFMLQSIRALMRSLSPG